MLDLWEQARLFALVNFAMADGFITGFDTRYLEFLATGNSHSRWGCGRQRRDRW